MSWDIALAPEKDGTLMAHRADCPYVRMLAANDVPVMTMLGCKKLPDLPFHDCLKT